MPWLSPSSAIPMSPPPSIHSLLLHLSADLDCAQPLNSRVIPQPSIQTEPTDRLGRLERCVPVFPSLAPVSKNTPAPKSRTQDQGPQHPHPRFAIHMCIHPHPLPHASWPIPCLMVHPIPPSHRHAPTFPGQLARFAPFARPNRHKSSSYLASESSASSASFRSCRKWG
ncbi:hypothetical protein BKA56DRAFT_226191 [Ilyonectria sp. MPI-CAGE-AT-0026]|nr:hypothetical protein BKA56DRAFT_226191 [Ilyonectria sp. MPI-CAGE-AT-0026]